MAMIKPAAQVWTSASQVGWPEALPHPVEAAGECWWSAADSLGIAQPASQYHEADG
jgi:hypothetical protein